MQQQCNKKQDFPLKSSDQVKQSAQISGFKPRVEIITSEERRT